ncbi:hypothetical protein SDC9_195462 [bioreactor metagenome]|uniref:Uncharacterized protein n=1 Tax=bioreactor metagenome TaxID=1076179 RepID=A0A645I9D1_9ZZZZ
MVQILWNPFDHEAGGGRAKPKIPVFIPISKDFFFAIAADFIVKFTLHEHAGTGYPLVADHVAGAEYWHVPKESSAAEGPKLRIYAV